MSSKFVWYSLAILCSDLCEHLWLRSEISLLNCFIWTMFKTLRVVPFMHSSCGFHLGFDTSFLQNFSNRQRLDNFDGKFAFVENLTVTHEDLLTIVKRCKLKWDEHVSCSAGLAKTILQGTMKGGRRQGRQRKRWKDNIKEWTGPEFAKSQKAVEKWEKWRQLVLKSPVVPQRPNLPPVKG